MMVQYLQASFMRDLDETLAKPMNGSPTNPNESGTPASRLIVITPYIIHIVPALLAHSLSFPPRLHDL